MTAADCKCGHGREAHEHYRPGKDCALCGAGVCRRYRPRGGLAARLGSVVRRMLGPRTP